MGMRENGNPAPDKPRRNITIRFGLSSAFSVIVVLTSILTGISTYVVFRQMMRNDLGKRIKDVTSIGVQLLDADAHRTLVSRDQETTGVYLRMKKTLQNIRGCDADLRFVYTMRRTEKGKYRFVVDAEEDTNEVSHIGDEYEDAIPVMEGLFEHPAGPAVESEFSTDKWGTWLSGYAPLMRGDTVEAILGVDISAARVIHYERLYLLIIAIISLITMSVVILIGLVFSRRITRPMMLLEMDMARIRDLKLDEDSKVASGFREIIRMKNSVENMKRGLRSFRKFVPADLVSQLIARDAEARFGGDKRNLTLFFSDIADFTTISEKMSPEDLVTMLAMYFGGMSKTIQDNRGTIDKYIGDAIMAFWGAPVANENHALDACTTALRCREFLATVNREWTEMGLPAFNTRIGINTGDVIVGNIGYEERLNYTVIGDNVNLASRLEGLNKFYGTSILISETTWQATREHVTARCVDIVAVKGKKIGFPIYELFGLKKTDSEEVRERMRAWDTAFSLYRQREWKKAQEMFESFMRQDPADKSAKLLAERCATYAENPPPQDWNGVIYLREK
jgi:adenylate cyclase